ncbi:MAG: GDP-mannose 4,6-dehydratase [Gemmatimonadales bacterium]
MTHLLVTGADGFVGRWLVRAARAEHYRVTVGIVPDAAMPDEWQGADNIAVVRADLRDEAGVARLAGVEADAVVHLAGVASGAAARRDPAAAMLVNAHATARLASLLAKANRPKFLLVSTGEVYGAHHAEAIAETAHRAPGSPYAESKAAAEDAVLVQAADAGLPVVIARAFPHTGPGQSTTFVLPALAQRLLDAKRSGAAVIRAGNLDAVRDFLDVRDVAQAYLHLVARGAAGTVYNVASGIGRRLFDCFTMLAELVGVSVRVEQDPALHRPADIPVLIGDNARLRAATGWAPRISFERTLRDLVDAQAD